MDINETNDGGNKLAMKPLFCSEAKIVFDKVRQDVVRLNEIHSDISGDQKGRKWGVEVLNRASIVFICACWESYIENLVTELFDLMIRNAKSPDVISTKVQARVVERSFAGRELDKRIYWELAGDGWKPLLKKYGETIRSERLQAFHSPLTENVDELFLTLLGIKNVSACWRWKKMSNETATKTLDEYVKMRGNIAHTTMHDETVLKWHSRNFLQHVERIVEKMEEWAKGFNNSLSR